MNFSLGIKNWQQNCLFLYHPKVKYINTEIDAMVRKKQILEKEYLRIRGKRRMLRHEEEKIRKDIVLSADVICCTLSASGSVLLRKLLDTTRYERAFSLQTALRSPPPPPPPNNQLPCNIL